MRNAGRPAHAATLDDQYLDDPGMQHGQWMAYDGTAQTVTSAKLTCCAGGESE